MDFGKKRGKIGREKESLSQLMDSFIIGGSAKSRIIIPMVFLALVCLSTTALGAGSISGHVYKHSDTPPLLPLQGVGVQLFQGVDENIADEHAWESFPGNWTQTNSEGFYQFTGLEPRRYHVNIYDQEVSGTHYVETDLYNVQVLEGTETVDMDFRLREAGLIYGYVKTTGNTPIPNARVISESAWTQYGHDWHDAWTNQDGRYEIWVLPSPGEFYPVWVQNAMIPGTTYKVYGGNTYISSGEDGYHPEDHGYTLLDTGTATKIFTGTYDYYIIVTYDGYVAKVDAVQGSDASYYGTYTTGNTSDWWNVSDYGEPDGQFASVGNTEWWGYRGGYILIDPASGNTSLKVYIVPDGRGADPFSYESKWDGNFYKATAPPAPGTQVDYSLEAGGMVTGRVVNESEPPVGIKDVRIEGAWNKWGEYGDEAYTDSDGYFRLGGLTIGDNYVCLENGWREIEQDGVKYMAGEVYRGPIDITAGGQTVPVDTFTIYEAGMITGLVTDESGLPIVGVEMELEGRDIDGYEVWREEVVTDAFGQFTFDYVAPGIYYLTCWKDGFILASETNLRVNSGEQVDVDLVMKSAAEGATISGRITNYSEVIAHDSEDVPFPAYSEYEDFGLAGFGLIALPMDKTFTDEDYLDIDKLFVGDIETEDIDDGYDDYFEPNTSDIPGTYTMCLPSGDIAIGMYIYQDVSPGWGGYAILHDWKGFNLAKGDVRENVNFTAVTANTGTLKGDIVPSGYDYFPGGWCSIYAYALDEQNNIKDVNPDGVAFPGWTTAYEFRGLPAGNYMLRAYARNLASVVILSVTVNANLVTTQNITFTSGGTLTGHITDGVSDVNNAVVTIVENGKQAITDNSGNYTITGINTGTYTVLVTVLGYADAEATVSVSTGFTTTQNFSLSSNVGSISGTVKEGNNNINGAAVVAYNETNDTHKTTETVAGAFTFTGLTPGEYILAVDTDDYGVVVHPENITLSPNEDITGIPIVVGTPEPPLFTVTSSVSDDVPAVLSMEFYSDRELLAVPNVEVVDGNGVPGSLTSNSALNRFEIDYTADVSDNMVRIQIAETIPLVGSPASKTFTFEVSENLVTTSSTNVTNATGGTTSIMGTQDNTEVYVPPFAIAGTDDDSQAVTLTIERYGDPGDAVEGTDAESVSAVYDFEFDDEGVSIDENHTFTITMSFQLPPGMTQQEFEDSLVIQYFDAGDQQWKTDGISNVRINWANWTIMFEVSHLTEFAAFVEGECCHPADTYCDNEISMLEILAYIDQWAVGDVSMLEVLEGIDLWAAGNYYCDDGMFKPGEQP